MPDAQANDPTYWRQQAAEARRTVELLTDLTAREHMLNCAKSYDRLAALAEQRRIAEQKAFIPS